MHEMNVNLLWSCCGAGEGDELALVSGSKFK